MKKSICLLLCFAMVLGMCAFTAASATEEKTVIKFWTFHTNEEMAFMESLGEEYAKVNPNVEVQFSTYPQDEYMGPMLTSAFSAEEGPDVFVMSPGDFLKYANSGIAMDLTPYFTDAMREDFLESSIEACTVDGKLVGIPFEIELLGIYYNIDMFAEAGVEIPTTWDEFIAATEKLSTDEVAGLLIEPTKSYYQNFTWYPFLWQGGGEVLDESTRKGTFEGPAVENALQLWNDLVKAGAPSSLPISGTWDVSMVGDGSAAMQLSGTWAVATFENDYPDTNVGLFPLPLPEGGQAATDAGGWKMMVNGKSPVAEEAAKFALWAFAENVELPLKWCTEVKFAYSPRKSVVEAGSAIYEKGLRKVFTDEIYASAIGEPRYPAEIVNAVGDALQGVMLNGEDPATAAKTANDLINAFLSTYEGSL